MVMGKRSLSLNSWGELMVARGSSSVSFLLRGADDPDFSLAEVLEVLGQALKIEDLVLMAADVLADLVDDEDDVFLAGHLADDVDHLLNAIIHQIDDIAARSGERLIAAEQCRIAQVGDAREDAVGHQLVIPVVGQVSPVSWWNSASNSAKRPSFFSLRSSAATFRLRL
jgi:hypothetical protein